ncbi:hypothetical protein [Tautonia rosea]|uniref:hypothetical protein n=1 Tax=Tautonia rosea TaxID=2728037 RepID=UPI0014733737|nr:hypothetical protein [Tautonia rosea]
MDTVSTSNDRRTEANRRNAQKSTGPKTAEGKARSRRNALRHGLAAEVLVPEADRGAVAAAIDEWNHEIWPENVAERAVIRRMAVADVRLQRCEQATERNLEATARSAVDRWRLRKQNAARKRACNLKTDPLNTLLDLEDSAFGCDWLIRRWSALDRTLEQGLGWTDDDRDTSMRLIGYVPVAPGPDGAPEARQMWRLGRLASGLEVEPAEPDEPNDPASARLALRALIADRLDQLEQRATASWNAIEDPERSAVIARSLSGDDGPEAQLRHRYDRDAQNSLLRSITMLIRIRKRRDELAEHHRKQARDHQVERINVGGGWWKEKDANACPPGFQPINRCSSHPREPIPSADSSTAPDPPIDSRNEPKPEGSSPRPPHHKPHIQNNLRSFLSDRSPPRPERSRPDPRPLIDRPEFPDRA